MPFAPTLASSKKFFNPRLDHSTVDEYLNLILESGRQINFEWHIGKGRLYFEKLLIDGKTVWDMTDLAAAIHDDDRENFRMYLRDMLKEKQALDGAIYNVDVRLKDPLREWRWIAINSRLADQDENGHPMRIIGSFSSIEPSGGAEVVRLRDLDATLRQANRAFARTNCRDALFRQVCRLVVEHGRLHLAWIGLVDHESNRLLPVAAYGNTHKLLQKTAIPIDGLNSESLGVIGTALKNKRPSVCNDVPGASGLMPGWTDTTEESLQSVASFPLYQSGKVFGTLNLYSIEKGYFDESMIGLLYKITSTLSHTLATLEQGTQFDAMDAPSAENEQIKSAILTATLDCIISINHKGEITSFNRAAERTFGYRSDDVVGKNLVDMILPHGLHSPRPIGAKHNPTSGNGMLNRRIELTAMRADGSVFPIELAIVPLSVEEGPVFIAFIRDISELKQRQALLRDSAMRYRQLVEFSPEAILVCRDGKLALLNKAACRLLGTSDASQLLGKSVFAFIHPDCHALLDQQARMPETGVSSPPFVEQVWIRSDGTPFHAEIAVTSLAYNDSPALQIVVRDITERKRNEELQLGQNRILNLVATGAKLTDILTEIARFADRQSSRGRCAILLLDTNGTTLSEKAAPGLPEAFKAQLRNFKIGPRDASCGTAAFRAEPVIVTDIVNDSLWEDKRHLALAHGLHACTSWPIFGKNRTVLGTFAFYYREPLAPAAQDNELFDICTRLAGIAIESRTSEERIRYLAHYDGLTSLPNRFLFDEYLDLALRNAQRHGSKFAVFFLDLDKFKDINDTHGHEAGDHVLREIAARLRGALRNTDKIARMGGDEFYILIEELADGRHAADVAMKLLIEASRPLHLGQQVYQLSASIGIAIYPEDGKDGATLLKNADDAMYQAKGLGKNGYQFHSTDRDAQAGR